MLQKWQSSIAAFQAKCEDRQQESEIEKYSTTRKYSYFLYFLY